MPVNAKTGQSYSIRPHPSKSGYHQHVYAGGRVVSVRGPHTAAEDGGGGGAQGAAADPYTAPAPPDPQLEQQRIATQQSLQIGDAWDQYSRTRLSNTYGIGDTSNPYSRAKLLEDSFRRKQGSTLGNYASQGQLYSGALNVAQNDDQRQFSIDKDQMERSYYDSLANIEKGRLDRYSSAGMAMDQGTLNSILEALQRMR